MLKARMKYGAVSAKVHAMYGKRITEEEWHRLSECSSVTEVLSVLKSQSGWGAYTSELTQRMGDEQIKGAVRAKQYVDLEKLLRFCSLEDKELLGLFLTKTEYGFILAALRCLASGEPVKMPIGTTEFIKSRSRVDISALESAVDYSDLIAAARGSAYENVLAELTPSAQNSLPNYGETAAALERCCYKSIFTNISKGYSGMGKNELSRLLGTQADLLNIVGILRLLRSFPGSLQSAQELLVPLGSRLKPALVSQLLSAKSESEAVELLKQSPFALYFDDYKPEKLDGLYESAMSSFCKGILRLPAPNICVPVAYLILSELECDRLARVLETVCYGIKPSDI